MPANTGDASLTPGLGRLHKPWGNWAYVPQLLKTMRSTAAAHNKKSRCSKKPVHLSKKQPQLAPTRERPSVAIKTQHSQKLKKKNFKKQNT